VNVHGFWNNANAKNHKDRSVLRHVPTAPPGRLDPQTLPQETWRNHHDRAATEKAEHALCTLPKVNHRDS
jgi:hypothetical protein